MRDMNHDNKIDSRDHALFDIANGSGGTGRPSRSSGTGSSGGCGSIVFAIIITVLLIKGAVG